MSTDTEINRRRTFAIISHPDAGKTTITEKLLLYGGAINLAGTVKGRKASRHATSDWMELEKQRGISVTTSVMQFYYRDCCFNLLDTPGHEDFSEDTYRTLTAVDSALMVVDSVKGVEDRTIKLMQVCRLRNTPILTFINKIDRDAKSPIELLDEIESVLEIGCAPITWPIGQGRHFKGVYHLIEDKVYLYKGKQGDTIPEVEVIDGKNNPLLATKIGQTLYDELQQEIELIAGASNEFSQEDFLAGKLTPVFFGSALNNIGVSHLLDAFTVYAPEPKSMQTQTREVKPAETKFTGFVFKIQANMDPKHRDRIAFLRVCSGTFSKDMKLFHVRQKRNIAVNSALTFLAGNREAADFAYPGDIIGLHNHGTIQVGDSFTCGENLKFTGIPFFAPLLFRTIRPKDPLKLKPLQKGLLQLAEEGAAQVFRPLNDNRIILGAVGVLQFDVVCHRLTTEYNVDCVYDQVNIATVRWLVAESNLIEQIQNNYPANVAADVAGNTVYLATSMVNLNLVQEKYHQISFLNTREI